MYEGDYFQLMAQYNRWMNQKLYVCRNTRCRAKGRLRCVLQIHPRDIESPSIRRQGLDGRFVGEPFNIKVIGQEVYANFEELTKAREKTDREILEWSRHLGPDWLNQPFKYKSNVDGKTRALPTWVLVIHMFNHQTHHRGQVTTLIKQLGYEPGITDIPWLPELKAVVK